MSLPRLAAGFVLLALLQGCLAEGLQDLTPERAPAQRPAAPAPDPAVEPAPEADPHCDDFGLCR